IGCPFGLAFTETVQTLSVLSLTYGCAYLPSRQRGQPARVPTRQAAPDEPTVWSPTGEPGGRGDRAMAAGHRSWRPMDRVDLEYGDTARGAELPTGPLRSGISAAVRRRGIARMAYLRGRRDPRRGRAGGQCRASRPHRFHRQAVPRASPTDSRGG